MCNGWLQRCQSPLALGLGCAVARTSGWVWHHPTPSIALNFPGDERTISALDFRAGCQWAFRENVGWALERFCCKSKFLQLLCLARSLWHRKGHRLLPAWGKSPFLLLFGVVRRRCICGSSIDCMREHRSRRSARGPWDVSIAASFPTLHLVLTINIPRTYSGVQSVSLTLHLLEASKMWPYRAQLLP